MFGLLTLSFLPGKLRMLVLGAALGMLTAPRAGKASRDLLLQRFR